MIICQQAYSKSKNFDQNELYSLSQSIKNNGIFQPIVVVSDKDEIGKYKIVAGERRGEQHN